MFDQELRAIEEELEKEKASDWPKIPPIQAHLGELQRKIQNLKKAVYNGDTSIIAAKGQLPSVIRVCLQLQRMEGELSALVSHRPILRRSVQILRSALQELRELGDDLRAYIDLKSYEGPALQGLAMRWGQVKSKAERCTVREEIRERVHTLIEEGCRLSKEEDLALAQASQELALEALASEV